MVGVSEHQGRPGPSGTLPEPRPRPPFGYLDAVAGQPLLPAAQGAWLAAAEQAWSDPARLHHPGRRAGLVLDAARASLAASLDARPDQVLLTSSGPTAVGVAVQGLVEQSGNGRPGGRRVVASAIESLAVLSPAQAWASEVDVVPVDPTGRLDLAALEAALREPAGLLCVQAANPEVGTEQDLERVASLAAEAGVPLLVHLVQVVGHAPIPAVGDVLAASARDWGGPAGVGILLIRDGVRWRPAENPDRGWVSGFPDIPAAAAAATALEYLQPAWADEARRHRDLTEQLRAKVPRTSPGVTALGHPDHRLPHVVTFACSGVTGEAVVRELGLRGISVASGSACTSDTRMPSQVLAAMGARADASIRVGLPFGCSDESVQALVDALPEALAEARR